MRERFLMLLTVVNLGVLAFTMADRRVVEASPDVQEVVRTRSLEIVDTQGRVRASLGVMPAEKRQDGQSTRDTTLLRLMTDRGRPAIKVSASEDGAGFMAAGATGTQHTYISFGSTGTTASIRMKNESGSEETIAPK
jgi:hypothetical protein